MRTEEDFADQLIAERREELGAWIRNLPCLPLNTKLVEMNVTFDDGTEVEIDLHVTVEAVQRATEATSAEPVPLPVFKAGFKWYDWMVAGAILGLFGGFAAALYRI